MRFGDDTHRRFDFDLELALLDAHLRELLVSLVKLDLLVGDRLASTIDGVTQVALPGLFDLGAIAQDLRLFLHAFAQAREHVVERLDTQAQNLELALGLVRNQQGLLELIGFLLERFDLLAQVPLTLTHRGKIDLDGRDLPFGAILAARQRSALLACGSRLLVKLALASRQLVLAVTELLDLGATRGRVLGNARATLLDLVLLL